MIFPTKYNKIKSTLPKHKHINIPRPLNKIISGMIKMIKSDPREKLNKVPKMCILDENKVCDNCCECFVCDLDPSKICDNCAKCLDMADYNAVEISDIILYDKKIFRYMKNNKKKSAMERIKTVMPEEAKKK